MQGRGPGPASELSLLRLVHLHPEPMLSLSPTEWDAVLRLAFREQVGPLAYAALQTAEGRVPPPVRDALARSYAQAAQAAAQAYAQVTELLRVLRSRDVAPVLLKGAALARFAYGDAALRPFNDVDLLVPLGQVDIVHHALRLAGYMVAGGTISAADRTWRHGRAYYDPQGRQISVDVHWRFAGYPLQVSLDYDGILGRAGEVMLAGEPARVLAPADMVVALCIHFLRDVWDGRPRLRYLRDLAEIVRRQAVDWPQVVGMVTETPAIRAPLYLTLAAAAELVGAPVPATLIAVLHPARWPVRGHFLLRWISRDLLRSRRPPRGLLQMTMIRWLDGGVPGMLRWMWMLFAAPRSLVGSRLRWWRALWR